MAVAMGATLGLITSWPVARARELGAYALAARPAEPRQVRIVIFGQGRTGSTLLEDLICATGQFHGYGELLGQEGAAVRHPLRYIDGHARLAGSRHMVCHVKPYHLDRDRERAGRTPMEPAAFVQAVADRGYRIVHLGRRNLLRHVVSNYVARARGAYHKLDDRPEGVGVRITREGLRERLAKRARVAEQERQALAGVTHLDLIYERDLEQPGVQQATTDRIMRFVGLPSAPTRTSLRKVTNRPLPEIVANWDEVREWAIEFGRAEDL